MPVGHLLLRPGVTGAISGAACAGLLCAGICLAGTYLFLGRGVLFRRRALYACFRAAALALVAFALYGPERLAESPVTRRHALAVLVDGSRSLRFPLASRSARTRRDALEKLLGRNASDFEELAELYDLTAYTFGRDLVRQERIRRGGRLALSAGPAEGDATALGDALLGAVDEAGGGGSPRSS